MGYVRYKATLLGGWTKNCHLTIADQNKRYEYPLPTPEKAGVALQANIDKNQIDIQIFSKNITSPLFISLQQGGKPVHYQSLGIDDHLQLSFNTDSLQQGVHQLTVFNHIGHILADRLFFVWKQEMALITLQDNNIKDKHQPYHPEEYSFKIQDKNGKSLPKTSFSVAVRDNDIEDLHYSRGNILTNLLLSSEIRGFILSPEYYFESQDSHHRKALDLLMMIQGWRRYDWQTMAGVKSFKPHYPIEQQLQVKGTVYKRRSSSGELKKWKKKFLFVVKYVILAVIPMMPFSKRRMATSLSMSSKSMENILCSFKHIKLKIK